MSRKMKSFADYFLAGMQMGGNWWNQAEQHAIARERSKLKAQADAIRNNREERRLSLYGQNVQADIALKQARTHRTMNPIAKGGGGGKGVDPEVAALEKRAAQRGIIAGPGGDTAAPPSTNGDGAGTSNEVTDNTDSGTVPVPEAEPVETTEGAARGGMIRGGRRYASGGIVEGMTLEEAKSYDSGFTPSSKPSRPSGPAPGGSALGGAMNKGISAGIDAYKAAKEKAKEVKPTGPKGSGEAGKYTEADLKPGGVLDLGSPYGAGGSGAGFRAGGAVRSPPRRDPNVTREPEDATGQDERYISGAPKHVPHNDSGSWYAEGGTVRFRRGGAVRRYEEGGAVASDDLTQGYDWKAAEKDREQKTQQQQTEQVAQQAQQKEEEETKKKQASGNTGGMGGAAFSFDGGSADGATGSGGDSTGGVSGTGGVGGSATDGSGGSAAAGTSGDAGSDGGGTYRRGGSVRRFQSGGRVMREQAIDTGTSGPGSGYGYRAAPPSRRY